MTRDDELGDGLSRAAQQFTPRDHAASAWSRGRVIRRRRRGVLTGVSGLGIAAAAGGIYLAGAGLGESAPMEPVGPPPAQTLPPPTTEPDAGPDPTGDPTSGPTDDDTGGVTEQPDPPCSTVGLDVGQVESGQAPAAVTEAAQQALAEVLACDSDALIERAEANDTVLGFGESTAAEALALPEQGEERYRLIALLLTATGEPEQIDAGDLTLWRWPALSGSETQDRELLEASGLYTSEELDQVFFDGDYYGWRIAFTADGGWQYLVAGD